LIQHARFKLASGTGESSTCLIAISPDNGKDWFFIDTAGKKIETIRTMLPGLSKEIIIPASVN
jgi:hypothetical protein